MNAGSRSSGSFPGDKEDCLSRQTPSDSLDPGPRAHPRDVECEIGDVEHETGMEGVEADCF